MWQLTQIWRCCNETSLYSKETRYQFATMTPPPNNKKLIVTFVQSSLCALIVAVVVHYISTLYPSSSKLQPNCNAKPQAFESFADFYPFYLCEHDLAITKLFHFVATFNVSVLILMLFNAKAASTKIRILIFVTVQAYGLAWISHFFLEKNKPATFKYPIYSFFGDWMMFKDALMGKVSLFWRWKMGLFA